jgi:pyruvate formate lyase activating enzyme
MLLGGLQKTTLIDFPGRVACTVFVVGCNFRCPFCHNKDLVTNKLFKQSDLKFLSEKEFFQFLEERKKILDGVCITGGEPTIHRGLPQFCRQIKDLGLQVKLDTNGSNPQMLKNLINDKLIDFVSMDIKTAFDQYPKAVGIKYQVSRIKKSISLILKSNIEYEFRTTIVPTIHDKEVLIQLAKDLKKIAQSLTINHQSLVYFLQSFQPKNCLDDKFLKIKPLTDQQMNQMLAAMQKILPNAKIRGGR